MLATQADAGMMELSLPIHWAQLPLITSQSCPQISDAHVSSGTRVVLCSVMLEERRRGSLVPAGIRARECQLINRGPLPCWRVDEAVHRLNCAFLAGWKGTEKSTS
eukprot:880486-Pelagomonas_calceolata.AAC.2